MRIAVIDGQGGGMGKAIIQTLRRELGEDTDILALGTNALATSLMLKAGANEGATGENAIAFNAPGADIIVGSIGILAADSMLGEFTERMAAAVAKSRAKKVLIPLNRCNIYLVGITGEPLPHYIDEAAQLVKNFLRGE
ncbi:MAG: DUF3842 family protein [Clostridia bacterium]|nr:DUF3842 family protein [Clostridia bacterium]